MAVIAYSDLFTIGRNAHIAPTARS